MIKLFISGRVGQDATIKNLADTTVCNFSVAHTEKGGSSAAEKTVWVSCSIWGERATKLKPYILKGTYVVVEGSGSVNIYMKDGQPQAVINCLVNSLEFGGKPNTENPKVTEETRFKSESELPF